MNKTCKPALRQFLIELVLAGLIFAWGLSSSLTESWYSGGLYPIVSVALRSISFLFPFALGDFLYLLLIGYMIWKLWLFSKALYRKGLERKHQVLIPLQLLNFLLILYIAFKLLWGLNYSRPSVSSSLAIGHKKYNVKELVMLGNFLIGRINALQQMKDKRPADHKTAYTIAELRQGAKQAYNLLAQKQAFFNYTRPSVKPVLNSWVITKIGIEGYYSPLSGEANVNMRIPPTELPFITCHEIAHQIGVAREDEANLVGYLVSTSSADPDFRYSGYYSILRNVLFEIRMKSPDDYKVLYKTINPGVLLNYKKDREFWRKYNGDMVDYFGAAFDNFLKLNNQKKGLNSYQDIVLWVYNFHEKELK